MRKTVFDFPSDPLSQPSFPILETTGMMVDNQSIQVGTGLILHQVIIVQGYYSHARTIRLNSMPKKAESMTESKLLATDDSNGHEADVVRKLQDIRSVDLVKAMKK